MVHMVKELGRLQLYRRARANQKISERMVREKLTDGKNPRDGHQRGNSQRNC